MPVIRIDYDKTKMTRKQITNLSEALQKIVSEETGIEDVFVYANSSQVTYNIAPIEVFIQMSASKIAQGDVDALFGKIRKRIAKWKKDARFRAKINMSFIPMNWKIVIGI